MNLVKVSLIVSAYNIENYIEKCIKSLVNQTLKEIEVIIVNDFSTDGTLKQIEKIKDNRIQIINNKKNEGTSSTRKKGLLRANGEYLLFIDGDDWIDLQTCEKLYNFSIKKKADVILYNLYKTNNTNIIGSIINNELEQYTCKELLLGKISISLVLKFIRRNFLIENRVEIPENISWGDDLAISYSIFSKSPKVSFFSDFLYYYYRREGSATMGGINEKIFQLSTAIDFAKRKLIEKNLYSQLIKEFEYMIYNNFLILPLTYKYNNFQDLLIIIKKFYSYNINIYKNEYIKERINNFDFIRRYLIKLFHINYRLGSFIIYILKKYQ